MAFSSFNSSGTQPMAEINTTPLVDVMLVLLVIFIITAPLFQQAVPVDLPRVDATRLEDPPQPLQVALDGAGKVFINGTPVHAGTLAEQLGAAALASATPPEMHLRADRATRYERVAEVMAAAQSVGITRIAFVTEGSGRAQEARK